MRTSSFRDYSGALILSVLGHVVLLLLFSFNLVFMPHKAAAPVKLAIEATVVDTTTVQRELEREQQRQIEAQRQQDEERRRQEEQRRLEQERIEQQRREAEAERVRLERERQQEAEQQRRREEEAAAAERQRKEEEARRAEEQRKAEAERQRIAAERARQAEIERQMAAALAAEEQRRMAVDSGLLAQYVALIENRVTRNWIKPGSATAGLDCIVHVQQIPGGEVVDVRVGQCNGDAAVIRSIEAAVYRSSPLPLPEDPSLFERNLRIRFKPEE